MKTLKLLPVWAVLFLPSLHARATVHYVNLNSATPSSPYNTWSSASTDIQSAINASSPGDMVLVTNGVYQTGNSEFFDTNTQYAVFSRIQIPGGVTVSSVNGPGATIIIGGGTAPIGCACLLSNAILNGFTLTNGFAGPNENRGLGGGAYCQTTNALLSNCLICSNNAAAGGGVYLGTLTNCVLSNNVAGGFIGGNATFYSGGGACGSVLNNCTLVGNMANLGGGAYNGILNNCMLIRNSAYTPSGTAYGGGAYGGVLNGCLVISNTAGSNVSGHNYLGIGGAACSNAMNNCLILYNQAGPDFPAVAQGSSLTNCTICFNGTNYGDDAEMIRYCTARNSILYYNIYVGNYVQYTGNNLQNCCLTPISTGSFTYGTNNVTNAPMFVNTNGDFHLQSNSPCINAGNNACVLATNDLDGNPRIAGGTVDIGAYEFQSPTSVISYAWLEQYGLPTDGSADYADPDGDGMNNWQEWIAGTNPNNAASRLAMNSVSNGVTGITVAWQSVSNVMYFLQRSVNLPAFTSLQSNLVGQTGSTSYTDITATNGGPYFYRIGVQH
jgi:hypothetical protein